jgi:4-amino-4-deoxy-L-arabinose transferase-like glycosyltransferase
MRLPHLLAAIAVLPLIWLLAQAMDFNRNQAAIALAIPASTIGFLLTAGTVMTDMFLCLSTTLVMVGFWRGWHGEKRFLLVMYAGIGLGLLAKGPVVVVLAGIAILPWILIVHGPGHAWAQIFRRLDFHVGIPLILLIAVPWYYLMEQTSPGFLEYFLIGEHWQRFIDSGWRGDLYGSGHARTRGTIWGYWFLFSFPWSLLLLIVALKRLLRFDFSALMPRDPAVLFLVLWMCSPMLLFTLAGNILPAYIVPGLPAIGLLVLSCCKPERSGRGRLLLLVGPLLLLAICVQLVLTADEMRSDRELLSHGIDSNHPLYYFNSRPYSAQYYSNGRARLVNAFPQQPAFYLAIRSQDKLSEIDEFCQLRSSNQQRRLYFCWRNNPA